MLTSSVRLLVQVVMLIGANQRWKSLKVTLNPPSWFRNGMGNLILMDIGTNTSIGKLIGMVVDEVNSWIKGSPSNTSNCS